MRWFYDVFGSNQLWPGLKCYVSQPAWHFNQSSQLLFSISVQIINMLLLFLNISPCWLKLKTSSRPQLTGSWRMALSGLLCHGATITNSLLISFANQIRLFWFFWSPLSFLLRRVLSNWCGLHVLIISQKHSLSLRALQGQVLMT